MIREGKMKSNIVVLSVLIVFASLLAWLVMAVAGESARIVSPASGTNYTSLTAVLFNVSFVNGTDITNPQNATFSLNVSGAWGLVAGNSSGCDVGATTSSCSMNVTNTTIPDGIYSVNATIYNATTSISITNTTNLSSKVIIDGTKPQAFPANFTGTVAANANLSSKAMNTVFYLNASLVDALIGIQAVVFNVTNISGKQNATFTATREGSTSYYSSAALNTSHFQDGTYNITIFVNDTLGNLNNSARIATLTFDDTLPSVAITCTPSTVTSGETETCSCSASDSTSGINTSYGSSGVSFTASPSTSNTGTFTVSCSAQDRAGNSNTASDTYTVEGQSSGSSSGGNSGGTASTPSTSGSNGSSTNPPAQSGTESNSGSNVGSGSSAQGTGAGATGGGLGTGIIIAIVLVVIIVVVVIVMVNRRK